MLLQTKAALIIQINKVHCAENLNKAHYQGDGDVA